MRPAINSLMSCLGEPPDPPEFTSIDPATGVSTGGTVVTITGTHLAHVDAVSIGGRPCTGVVNIDDETVRATAPAGVVGTQDVVIASRGGSDTAADAFEYTSAISIDSITPDSGPALGGTTVTVVLDDGVADLVEEITFDGVPGTGLTVTDVDTMTVVTPAGSAGNVDVVVDAGDYGSDTAANGFEYT